MTTFPDAFPDGQVIAHEFWYALEPHARHQLLMELAERHGIAPVGYWSIDGDLPDFGGGPGALPGADPVGLSVEITKGQWDWKPYIIALGVGLGAALIASA